ncbi:Phenylalanine--tRNA ligase beta subunit [bacterium HR35]|nr:Phenylalanine--tRNA ligase beta subunit [bacterium HR35]
MKFRLKDLKNYLEGNLDGKKIAETLTLKSFESSYENGILDVDILYNRFSDSASFIGIAKEISLLSNLKFKAPQTKFKESNKKIIQFIKVQVKTPKTPFYFGRVILNLKNQPSPDWLKEILEFYGLNSINLIVDLANLVMFEYGAPLHIFDLDKIFQKEIIVREAKKGEKFISLEDKEYELRGGEIVISDREKILALAGIKGSKLAEVNLQTKNIFIEAAVFDPTTIYQTSRIHNLKTEASLRFERNVNPYRALEALERISFLIKKFAKGEVLKGKIAYGKLPSTKKIEIKIDEMNKFLGTNFNFSQIKFFLKKLNFNFKEKSGILEVYPPLDRNDLQIKEDIYEEILRIYGVNNVKENFESAYHPSLIDENFLFNFRLREILKNFGFSEIYSYSLFSQKDEELFKDVLKENQQPIELANPLSENLKFYEFSLLPNLLKGLSLNQKIIKDLKIFRIERVAFLENEKIKENYNLALTLTQKDKTNLLIELKTIWQIIKKGLKIDIEDKFEEINLSFLAKGAKIVLDNKEIGFLGLLNEKIKTFYDLEKEIGILEINLQSIKELTNDYKKFVFWGDFPEVIRDLSFVVDSQVKYQEIKNIFASLSISFLKEIILLDIYFLNPQKKSFTFRFIFQSKERTLTEEEVNSEIEKIKNILENKLKVEFR